MDKSKKYFFALFLAVFLMFESRIAWADFASAQRAYDAGSYALTLKEIRPLAEAGDPEAQTLLATMYAKGQGLAKDDDISFSWYLAAAEQGNSEAQIALSDMFENGRGTARNLLMASYWQWKAANSFEKAAKNQLISEINKANVHQIDLEIDLKQKKLIEVNKEGKARACIPDYPALIQRKDFQGTTVVSVLFDINGKAEELNLIHSSGSDALDNAVKAGFKRCKFETETIEGYPVRRFSIFKYFWTIRDPL